MRDLAKTPAAILPPAARVVPPGTAALAERMTRLLAAHRADLTAYARRHVPPDLAREVDAQDVVQDVAIEAFRRLHQFVPKDADADRRWLLTIARNRIINLVAARRADKRGGGWVDRLRDASPDDVVALLEQLAVYERTPSRSAVDRELFARLHVALDLLPADQRLAVRLRYIEGRPAADVAARMGRSEGAVHMLVSRSLVALRDALAEREASRP